MKIQNEILIHILTYKHTYLYMHDFLTKWMLLNTKNEIKKVKNENIKN